MLKLYHAEPVANSLKSLIPLHEKGLPFESVYVDLHKFEQHEPWFVALNPDGQVPVLDHDGIIVTHTTVINEYLEDAFPDAPPLRPADAAGKARMRYWNKFIEQQLTKNAWLAGDTFTLADANFFSHCGMMLERMFPAIGNRNNCPRLLDWVDRMRARPGVARALAGPDKTNRALRTFTGEVH